MRATSSRALMSALLATTYLLSICPEFAYGSTQVVYIENDERDHASSLDERSHLRTVTSGDDSHRRHLSFWGGLLNHLVCPTHPHDCHPHFPHPHKKSGGGGSSHSSGSGSGGNSGGSGSGNQTSDGDANDSGNNNNDNDQQYDDDNDNDDGNSEYDVYNNNNNNNTNSGGGNGGGGNNNDLVSNDDSDWYKGNSQVMGDMMYGAIGLGGIAVVGSLISRSRRSNVNMKDHLLSGAVGKRKDRFSGLFRKKPSDHMDPEAPGATPYTKA